MLCSPVNEADAVTLLCADGLSLHIHGWYEKWCNTSAYVQEHKNDTTGHGASHITVCERLQFAAVYPSIGMHTAWLKLSFTLLAHT